MQAVIREKIAKAINAPQLIPRWIHAKFVVRPRRYLSGYAFDMANKVRTELEVKNIFLDPVNADSLKHTAFYQAAPINYLKRLFQNLPEDPPDTCFIDIGCGKGRACFYAARRYREIIGVDFSPSLIEKANANLQTFSKNRQSNIRFDVQDARTYQLPDRRSLVFLYNPFDAHVFKEFLDTNRLHFIRHGSRLAYMNDTCREFLRDYGLVQEFRDPEYRISIYSPPENWHLSSQGTIPRAPAR